MRLFLFREIFFGGMFYLHSVSKSLVQLGDLGGDAQVDSAVANLNDKTAEKVMVDLECLV